MLPETRETPEVKVVKKEGEDKMPTNLKRVLEDKKGEIIDWIWVHLSCCENGDHNNVGRGVHLMLWRSSLLK